MINRLLGTILGQILTISAGASALTFLLFVVLLLAHPPAPPPPPWPWPDAYRIAGLIESILAVPQADRTAVAAAATRHGFSVRLTSAPVPCGGLRPDALRMQEVLNTELHGLTPNAVVRSCDVAASDPSEDVQILAAIGDLTLDIRTGNVSSSPPGRLPLVMLPFIGTLLFLGIAVASMSAWASWRVIGPLRRLAERANRFGHQIAAGAIEEEGPREIRLATRAFNLMEERVARSVRDRTRMLAAISHDLRTPLTRMRLQLEMGQANIVLGKLIRDVGLMQSMVTSALALLSGNFDEEEKEWFDLGALLSTLCDEFGEAGASLNYAGPERIRFFCRPIAITRAMTNLIENGRQFGSQVTVSASIQDDNAIIIDVADNGPGIPEQQLLDAIEPFVRLDPSRPNPSGSVGLGLSIVEEIVRAHRGTLTLINKQPNGLIARLEFPASNSETSLAAWRGASHDAYRSPGITSAD